MALRGVRLLAACLALRTVAASRGAPATSLHGHGHGAVAAAVARKDSAAPHDTKHFGTELQMLVQQVSDTISGSLNRSYSLAVQEDMKYKQLRDKLRSGIQDLVKGQEALQAQAPREQLRQLAEVRRAIGGQGGPLLTGGAAAAAAHPMVHLPAAQGAAAPEAAEVPEAPAGTGGDAEPLASTPLRRKPPGSGPKDEESAQLHRSAEALRQELEADGREEAMEVADIVSGGDGLEGHEPHRHHFASPNAEGPGRHEPLARAPPDLNSASEPCEELRS